ncbi:MAG: hypothetical protein LBR07_05830, partial [Puniceicoccales bacterium]|nr:hypothetical protein [Puniceicoccales bacterium]
MKPSLIGSEANNPLASRGVRNAAIPSRDATGGNNATPRPAVFGLRRAPRRWLVAAATLAAAATFSAPSEHVAPFAPVAGGATYTWSGPSSPFNENWFFAGGTAATSNWELWSSTTAHAPASAAPNGNDAFALFWFNGGAGTTTSYARRSLNLTSNVELDGLEFRNGATVDLETIALTGAGHVTFALGGTGAGVAANSDNGNRADNNYADILFNAGSGLSSGAQLLFANTVHFDTTAHAADTLHNTFVIRNLSTASGGIEFAGGIDGTGTATGTGPAIVILDIRSGIRAATAAASASSSVLLRDVFAKRILKDGIGMLEFAPSASESVRLADLAVDFNEGQLRFNAAAGNTVFADGTFIFLAGSDGSTGSGVASPTTSPGPVLPTSPTGTVTRTFSVRDTDQVVNAALDFGGTASDNRIGIALNVAQTAAGDLSSHSLTIGPVSAANAVALELRGEHTITLDGDARLIFGANLAYVTDLVANPLPTTAAATPAASRFIVNAGTGGGGIVEFKSTANAFRAITVNAGELVTNAPAGHFYINRTTGFFGAGQDIVIDGSASKLRITGAGEEATVFDLDNETSTATGGTGAKITIRGAASFIVENAALALRHGTLDLAKSGNVNFLGKTLIGSTAIINVPEYGFRIAGNIALLPGEAGTTSLDLNFPLVLYPALNKVQHLTIEELTTQGTGAGTTGTLTVTSVLNSAEGVAGVIIKENDGQTIFTNTAGKNTGNRALGTVSGVAGTYGGTDTAGGFTIEKLILASGSADAAHPAGLVLRKGVLTLSTGVALEFTGAYSILGFEGGAIELTAANQILAPQVVVKAGVRGSSVLTHNMPQGTAANPAFGNILINAGSDLELDLRSVTTTNNPDPLTHNEFAIGVINNAAAGAILRVRGFDDATLIPRRAAGNDTVYATSVANTANVWFFGYNKGADATYNAAANAYVLTPNNGILTSTWTSPNSDTPWHYASNWGAHDAYEVADGPGVAATIPSLGDGFNITTAAVGSAVLQSVTLGSLTLGTTGGQNGATIAADLTFDTGNNSTAAKLTIATALSGTPAAGRFYGTFFSGSLTLANDLVISATTAGPTPDSLKVSSQLIFGDAGAPLFITETGGSRSVTIDGAAVRFYKQQLGTLSATANYAAYHSNWWTGGTTLAHGGTAALWVGYDTNGNYAGIDSDFPWLGIGAITIPDNDAGALVAVAMRSDLVANAHVRISNELILGENAELRGSGIIFPAKRFDGTAAANGTPNLVANNITLHGTNTFTGAYYDPQTLSYSFYYYNTFSGTAADRLVFTTTYGNSAEMRNYITTGGTGSPNLYSPVVMDNNEVRVYSSGSQQKPFYFGTGNEVLPAVQPTGFEAYYKTEANRYYALGKSGDLTIIDRNRDKTTTGNTSANGTGKVYPYGSPATGNTTGTYPYYSVNSEFPYITYNSVANSAQSFATAGTTYGGPAPYLYIVGFAAGTDIIYAGGNIRVFRGTTNEFHIGDPDGGDVYYAGTRISIYGLNGSEFPEDPDTTIPGTSVKASAAIGNIYLRTDTGSVAFGGSYVHPLFSYYTQDSGTYYWSSAQLDTAQRDYLIAQGRNPADLVLGAYWNSDGTATDTSGGTIKLRYYLQETGGSIRIINPSIKQLQLSLLYDITGGVTRLTRDDQLATPYARIRGGSLNAGGYSQNKIGYIWAYSSGGGLQLGARDNGSGTLIGGNITTDYLRVFDESKTNYTATAGGTVSLYNSNTASTYALSGSLVISGANTHWADVDANGVITPDPDQFIRFISKSKTYDAFSFANPDINALPATTTADDVNAANAERYAAYFQLGLSNVAFSGYSSGAIIVPYTVAGIEYYYLLPAGSLTNEWQGDQVNVASVVTPTDYLWSDPNHWLLGYVPDGASASATIRDLDTTLATASRAIYIDQPVTLHELYLENTGATLYLVPKNYATDVLTITGTAANPGIIAIGGVAKVIAGTIHLEGDTILKNNSGVGNRSYLLNNFTGTGNLTITGGNDRFTFAGDNSGWSGNFTLSPATNINYYLDFKADAHNAVSTTGKFIIGDPNYPNSTQYFGLRQDLRYYTTYQPSNPTSWSMSGVLTMDLAAPNYIEGALHGQNRVYLNVPGGWELNARLYADYFIDNSGYRVSFYFNGPGQLNGTIQHQIGSAYDQQAVGLLGVVSGTGGINKNGPGGPLALPERNTFTGGFLWNDGDVAIGPANAFGDPAGVVTFALNDVSDYIESAYFEIVGPNHVLNGVSDGIAASHAKATLSWQYGKTQQGYIAGSEIPNKLIVNNGHAASYRGVFYFNADSAAVGNSLIGAWTIANASTTAADGTVRDIIIFGAKHVLANFNATTPGSFVQPDFWQYMLGANNTFSGGINLIASNLVIAGSSTFNAAGTALEKGPLGTGTIRPAVDGTLWIFSATDTDLHLGNTFDWATYTPLAGQIRFGGALTELPEIVGETRPNVARRLILDAPTLTLRKKTVTSDAASGAVIFDVAAGATLAVASLIKDATGGSEQVNKDGAGVLELTNAANSFTTGFDAREGTLRLLAGSSNTITLGAIGVPSLLGAPSAAQLFTTAAAVDGETGGTIELAASSAAPTTVNISGDPFAIDDRGTVAATGADITVVLAANAILSTREAAQPFIAHDPLHLATDLAYNTAYLGNAADQSGIFQAAKIVANNGVKIGVKIRSNDLRIAPNATVTTTRDDVLREARVVLSQGAKLSVGSTKQVIGTLANTAEGAAGSVSGTVVGTLEFPSNLTGYSATDPFIIYVDNFDILNETLIEVINWDHNSVTTGGVVKMTGAKTLLVTRNEGNALKEGQTVTGVRYSGNITGGGAAEVAPFATVIVAKTEKQYNGEYLYEFIPYGSAVYWRGTNVPATGNSAGIWTQIISGSSQWHDGSNAATGLVPNEAGAQAIFDHTRYGSGVRSLDGLTIHLNADTTINYIQFVENTESFTIGDPADKPAGTGTQPYRFILQATSATAVGEFSQSGPGNITFNLPIELKQIENRPDGVAKELLVTQAAGSGAMRFNGVLSGTNGAVSITSGWFATTAALLNSTAYKTSGYKTGYVGFNAANTLSYGIGATGADLRLTPAALNSGKITLNNSVISFTTADYEKRVSATLGISILELNGDAFIGNEGIPLDASAVATGGSVVAFPNAELVLKPAGKDAAGNALTSTTLTVNGGSFSVGIPGTTRPISGGANQTLVITGSGSTEIDLVVDVALVLQTPSNVLNSAGGAGSVTLDASVNAGASLELAYDDARYAGSLNNIGGTVLITGDGTSVASTTNSAGGSITVSADDTVLGSINNAAGASIAITGDNATFSGGTNSGTITIDSTAAGSGAATNINGALTNAAGGSIFINSPLDFATGGSITNSGTLEINAPVTGSISIIGAGGTVIIDTSSSGQVFNNNSFADLLIVRNGALDYDATVNNAAANTLRIEPGAGVAVTDDPATGNGTASFKSVSLEGAGSHLLITNPNTAAALSGGTLTAGATNIHIATGATLEIKPDRDADISFSAQISNGATAGDKGGSVAVTGADPAQKFTFTATAAAAGTVSPSSTYTGEYSFANVTLNYDSNAQDWLHDRKVTVGDGSLTAAGAPAATLRVTAATAAGATIGGTTAPGSGANTGLTLNAATLELADLAAVNAGGLLASQINITAAGAALAAPSLIPTSLKPTTGANAVPNVLFSDKAETALYAQLARVAAGGSVNLAAGATLTIAGNNATLPAATPAQRVTLATTGATTVAAALFALTGETTATGASNTTTTPTGLFIKNRLAALEITAGTTLTLNAYDYGATGNPNLNAAIIQSANAGTNYAAPTTTGANLTITGGTRVVLNQSNAAAIADGYASAFDLTGTLALETTGTTLVLTHANHLRSASTISLATGTTLTDSASPSAAPSAAPAASTAAAAAAPAASYPVAAALFTAPLAAPAPAGSPQTFRHLTGSTASALTITLGDLVLLNPAASTLFAGHLSLASTRALYFDGRAGTDYLDASTPALAAAPATAPFTLTLSAAGNALAASAYILGGTLALDADAALGSAAAVLGDPDLASPALYPTSLVNAANAANFAATLALLPNVTAFSNAVSRAAGTDPLTTATLRITADTAAGATPLVLGSLLTGISAAAPLDVLITAGTVNRTGTVATAAPDAVTWTVGATSPSLTTATLNVAGDAAVSVPARLGTGALTVNTGSTIALTAAADLSLANLLTGAGTLAVNLAPAGLTAGDTPRSLSFTNTAQPAIGTGSFTGTLSLTNAAYSLGSATSSVPANYGRSAVIALNTGSFLDAAAAAHSIGGITLNGGALALSAGSPLNISGSATVSANSRIVLAGDAATAAAAGTAAFVTGTSLVSQAQTAGTLATLVNITNPSLSTGFTAADIARLTLVTGTAAASSATALAAPFTAANTTTLTGVSLQNGNATGDYAAALAAGTAATGTEKDLLLNGKLTVLHLIGTEAAGTATVLTGISYDPNMGIFAADDFPAKITGAGDIRVEALASGGIKFSNAANDYTGITIVSSANAASTGNGTGAAGLSTIDTNYALGNTSQLLITTGNSNNNAALVTFNTNQHIGTGGIILNGSTTGTGSASLSINMGGAGTGTLTTTGPLISTGNNQNKITLGNGISYSNLVIGGTTSLNEHTEVLLNGGTATFNGGTFANAFTTSTLYTSPHLSTVNFASGINLLTGDSGSVQNARLVATTEAHGTTFNVRTGATLIAASQNALGNADPTTSAANSGANSGADISIAAGATVQLAAPAAVLVNKFTADPAAGATAAGALIVQGVAPASGSPTGTAITLAPAATAGNDLRTISIVGDDGSATGDTGAASLTIASPNAIGASATVNTSAGASASTAALIYAGGSANITAPALLPNPITGSGEFRKTGTGALRASRVSTAAAVISEGELIVAANSDLAAGTTVIFRPDRDTDTKPAAAALHITDGVSAFANPLHRDALTAGATDEENFTSSVFITAPTTAAGLAFSSAITSAAAITPAPGIYGGSIEINLTAGNIALATTVTDNGTAVGTPDAAASWFIGTAAKTANVTAAGDAAAAVPVRLGTGAIAIAAGSTLALSETTASATNAALSLDNLLSGSGTLAINLANAVTAANAASAQNTLTFTNIAQPAAGTGGAFTGTLSLTNALFSLGTAGSVPARYGSGATLALNAGSYLDATGDAHTTAGLTLNTGTLALSLPASATTAALTTGAVSLVPATDTAATIVLPDLADFSNSAAGNALASTAAADLLAQDDGFTLATLIDITAAAGTDPDAAVRFSPSDISSVPAIYGGSSRLTFTTGGAAGTTFSASAPITATLPINGDPAAPTTTTATGTYTIAPSIGTTAATPTDAGNLGDLLLSARLTVLDLLPSQTTTLALQSALPLSDPGSKFTAIITGSGNLAIGTAGGTHGTITLAPATAAGTATASTYTGTTSITDVNVRAATSSALGSTSALSITTTAAANDNARLNISGGSAHTVGAGGITVESAPGTRAYLLI